MKELRNLYNWMNGRTLEYNQEAKDRFKERGLADMRKLAKRLKLREFEASFNAGGIAVPGDLHLKGMFKDGVGIYVKISQGVFSSSPECLYRTMKGMKDYSGGSNNWAKTADMFEELPKLIHRLCGINPEDLVGVKTKNAVKPATSIKQKVGKFKQEEYDEIYKEYQLHFANGNYFKIGSWSHERIHDLTMATLAYKKHVKTQKESHEFLHQRFTFTGGKCTIERLLNSYRDVI